MISSIIQRFYSIIRISGNLAAISCLLLIGAISADVFLRYLFSLSFPWLFELEWHLFSLTFLFGASYAFQNDKHVRVDLVYGNLNRKKKHIVNALGNLLFLLPFSIIGAFYSFRYTENSFEILEGSPDPGGLPLRFIIKSCIGIMFILLAIQALVFSFFPPDQEIE